MATEVLEKVESPTTYLNNGHTVKSWLLTLDHKRIALLYLFSISIFFLIGGIYAALIRLELITPEGDLLTPDTYNRVFTMHGVIMIFFFLIPSIPAVLGNFLLPIMLGAKDVAFPKLNLLSWYVFMLGGALMMYTLINGGIDTGWTFYPPYSSIYSNSEVTMAGVSIFITGFSSILTGLNFMVTIHTMRAPGLTWFRLPLFVWAHYATSLIQILGTPVIAITVLALALERSFQIGIFDPKLGGDPVLFQHMFWFYSHPAVYIMILPSMGVISEIIATSTRKRIFGYHFVAFSSLAIAVFGFLVWGHHMFTSSQSMYAGMVFSIISYAVAIPSAIKTFNWLATIYKGSVSFNTPMIYALAFLGLFTIGGMTGLFLSALGLDVHLHDTYFVVAHFHYVMVGGAIIGYLGAIHYWWPKMTGKMYPETLGRISAVIIFVGFNFTFFPQFILGYLGMPRRYYAYVPEFQVLHVLSSGGALVLGVGFILPLFYLTWSIKYGKKVPNNPWMAYGLEWQTSSPPPTENFTFDPVVTTEAYEYEHVEEIRNAGKSAGLQTA
ncbi:MAG: cytochrome c oxidase subunit I [Blastocatellia bacterium]